MNQEIKAQWVAALRSGKYTQTTGRLRHAGKYCCLGVLCDLHSEATNTAWDNEAEQYLGHTLFLPPAVHQWAGLDPSAALVYTGELYEFAALNDAEKLDFDTIATIIENEA